MNPNWRSLLFVPADQPRLLEKADTRGADAVILDLEDAVPAAAKAQARAGIGAWIDHLAGRGTAVVVRINAGWLDGLDDLAAVVRPGLAAVLLPQVKDDLALRALAGIIGEWEARAGMAAGAIGLIALIEHPATLAHLGAIAAIDRVIGLALGSEDFSLALGAPPAPPALTLACQHLALAAASRRLMALGLPDTLANFTDLDRYGHACTAARAMGMTGALCIHPAQIGAVNAAFAPSAAERAWAGRVLAAWAEAQARGAGVTAVDGKMIDRPVVERAQAIAKFDIA